ncbi:DMT family transporter [Flavimaricola marinus]|uniref:EamA-like transporter family protein n=1 Tax=Flavimaricola marinus TaxID=1819565 RepID=A0A238LGE6_9RHOB|nr:DMT family transporter [Flavimaricola marinus]SMY08759.1 EamA-like transporter family protein [Flavimaricola marinus]
MDWWIVITLMAATAQTGRFVLQKRLKGTGLSTGGATFARFVYSAPLALLGMLAYSGASGQGVPGLSWSFWAYALAGGTAQILATMCVVALFSHRHFAVGITFKKTEVLMSVLVGLIVLGEGVSWLGLAAIVLGLIGVLLLSDPPGGEGAWLRRIANRAVGLGLASGVMFAVSGVGYRGASLSLETGDSFQRALVTLACVTAFQLVAMALWLAWRERGEITRVLAAWRVAGLVGLTSLIGSACWFTAFTLQTVAYVNAVGQIEVILSLMAGALIFGERISAREWQGVVLVGLSVLALVLVT